MTVLTVTELGHRGDGVAHHEGRRVFIPNALPGERVEVELDGDRGTLVAILDASPDRVAPPCPHFGTCGGCTLQHVGQSGYAAFKRALVVAALEQARVEADVAPMLDATGAGRRRTTLHADKTGAGYMRARSHDLLDIDACPILVPSLRTAAPRVAREIGAQIGECDVLITATGTGLDVSVRTDKTLKPEKLAPLAQRLRVTRFSLNGEVIFQLAVPVVTIGNVRVDLPPAAFLQATAEAENALADLVIAGIGKARAVADLFCGIGPFALRLARQAKVAAFDADGPAIAALHKAVRNTQGLKPLTTSARDLFRDPLAPAELMPFEAVVFDPPRAGAEAQARELARSKVPTVVGVSCDPTTFARDASILIAGGYRLETVTPLDQFAYATHVELVGTFRR